MGDVVKVWSLQSFHGGGFLKGETAIVRQKQIGDSVILIVTRKPDSESIHPDFVSCDVLDINYEVYHQQIELVKEATYSSKKNIQDFLKINENIRSYEETKDTGKFNRYLWSYAPEFYIDDDFEIKLNKDILKYPEIFI